MKQPIETFSFPDPKFRYSKRAHFLHLIILGVSIFTISTVAIFYSLGYQLNFRARTIQQTGLVTVDSKLDQSDVHISINSTDVVANFPYRSKPLFPGTYTLSITKDGYQPWTRVIDVQANKVSSFKTIVLLKKDIVSVPASESEQATLATARDDNSDIEIHFGNELWINGKFITRTSSDITAARWFTDRNHVAYQTGSSILFAELDGLHTQQLVALKDSTQATFVFTQNGKHIIYSSDGTYYSADIY